MHAGATRGIERQFEQLNGIDLLALPPGLHADGHGLFLEVGRSGARAWILETRIGGQEKRLDLGPLAARSLALVRREAASLRARANRGEPLEVPWRRPALEVPTFGEAALEVHRRRLESTSAEQARRWLASLERHAFPALAASPVDTIGVEEILRVVGPIWNARPETARRLLAHIRAVLEHCEVAGYRSGPDPCEGAREELPGQRPVPDARPPLAYEAVPALVGELRQTGASVSARLATEFLILTAARTAEVLDARWEAIDPDRALWRIREAFARNASARTVPLSPQALDLLGLARRFRSSELVFPSPKKPDRPLSNMAILMLLRRMGRDQARPQGFRTAFRAWAQERTSVDDNLIDRGLGYRPPGMGLPHRTEAAVSPEHRRLFEDWSLFVTGSAR